MADSDAEGKGSRDSKENRWYYQSLDNHISLEARELLEKYSQIPADEVDTHIYKMVSSHGSGIRPKTLPNLCQTVHASTLRTKPFQRDILWSHAPYPCIGEFKFLNLNLSSHPQYKRILQTIKRAATDFDASTDVPLTEFLDLGCCVAQELRALVHAGVQSGQLYGSDLNPHFLTTSYDLFKDKEFFEGKLVSADIFLPDLFEESFKGWENKFGVIHAGLFLHLFSWEQQVAVCSTIVKLLSPRSGSLFVGEMVGCVGGGERNGGKGTKFWKIGEERRQFLHDSKSFQKLWDEVAQQTETVGKWKIEGDLKVRRANKDDPTAGCAFFTGEGIRWFVFSVERVVQ